MQYNYHFRVVVAKVNIGVLGLDHVIPKGLHIMSIVYHTAESCHAVDILQK